MFTGCVQPFLAPPETRFTLHYRDTAGYEMRAVPTQTYPPLHLGRMMLPGAAPGNWVVE